MLCTKFLVSLRTTLYLSAPLPWEARGLICTHWHTGTGKSVARRSGSLKIALENVSQLCRLRSDNGRWTNSRTPGVIFDAARSAMISGCVV